MARTLPWTAAHAPPPKKARVTPAARAKQGKLSSPVRSEKSDNEVTLSGRGRVPKANATPSSSRESLAHQSSRTNG